MVALTHIFHSFDKMPFALLEKKPATLEEARKETPENLVCECTADMQYLRQYFFIREYAYKVDLGLKHFSGKEDAIDQYSHFIVARKGHFCVGGGRLTVSSMDCRVALPLESEHFKVIDILPELKNTNYCELGRLAILPDHRKHGCLEGIFEHSAEVAKSLGCTYMMGVSPPLTARRFKAAYQNLGYHSEIRNDIEAPVKSIHEHLELCFILVKLM